MPIIEKLSLPKISFNSLEDAKKAAMKCQKCELHKTRTNIVFSQGNPKAKVMLIGEGPGQNEDESGIPFVGRAGKLLDKILETTGINREKDLYICNIVKCRPPNNRKPTSEEIECCSEYLLTQIKLVQPKFILLAGATAVKGILKTREGITKIRGNWYEDIYGAKAMPIFHPSYLLRNPSMEEGKPKWLMLQDMQIIKNSMEQLN